MVPVMVGSLDVTSDSVASNHCVLGDVRTDDYDVAVETDSGRAMENAAVGIAVDRQLH